MARVMWAKWKGGRGKSVKEEVGGVGRMRGGCARAAVTEDEDMSDEEGATSRGGVGDAPRVTNRGGREARAQRDDDDDTPCQVRFQTLHPVFPGRDFAPHPSAPNHQTNNPKLQPLNPKP